MPQRSTSLSVMNRASLSVSVGVAAMLSSSVLTDASPMRCRSLPATGLAVKAEAPRSDPAPLCAYAQRRLFEYGATALAGSVIEGGDAMMHGSTGIPQR